MIYYDLYECSKCNNKFPPTTEYFYKYLLRNLDKPEKKTLGQCKVCATSYAKNYNSQRTQKKMMRENNWWDKTSIGKVYVIGIDDKHPLKIGICTGTTIGKRMRALQTSHWLNLKIFYESPVIKEPREIEKQLHHLYENKKVRGEWYDIRLSELEKIKSIVEPS